MNHYENTFVIDAQLPDEVIQEKAAHYQEVVSANKGEILHVEVWGNRKLAYQIRKKTHGYYVFMQFSAPPEAIEEFERALRLDESILRYLTVLIDAKAIRRDSEEDVGQKEPTGTRPKASRRQAE